MTIRFFCMDCSRWQGCKGPIGPECTGNQELFILGEAPGETEEKKATPFVGPSGDILRTTLQHLNYKGHSIANSVCCFKKGNPKPTKREIGVCRHWESWTKNPKVIVCLGATASKAVLGTHFSMTGQVGNVYEYNGTPVVICYHPAYIARQRHNKMVLDAWGKTWETVQQILDEKYQKAKLPKVDCLIDPDKIITRLKSLELPIAIDYETTGLRPELQEDFRIYSVGVSNANGTFAFLFDSPVCKLSIRNKVFQAWRRVITKYCERVGIVAHNAKYEHKCNLVRFGVTFGRMIDTMILAHHHDENSPNDLDSVASSLGIPWAGYKRQFEECQVSPETSDPTELMTYNGVDAKTCLECFKELTKRVPPSSSIAYGNLCALALARVEINGVGFNVEASSKVSTEANLKRIKLDKELKKLAINEGIQNFNGRSPAQCVKFVNAFGGGVDNARKESLTECKHIPEVAKLMEYRELVSLVDKFISKWGQLVTPQRLIHSKYNQANTVTGRLSSSDPNLQQAPTRSYISQVFCSRYKDGMIISADYSQLEPRIVAALSGDEGMQNIFLTDGDIHSYVASQLFDISYDKFVADVKKGNKSAKALRDFGKRMGLGILYGMSAKGLASRSELSEEESRNIIQRYYARFPQVVEWKDEVLTHVKRKGYVENIFGRRRHLPDIEHPNYSKRSHAERQAVNFGVQSTGNSLTLMSIFRLSSSMCVCGTVHDSIWVDSPNNKVFETAARIKSVMESHNRLTPEWTELGVSLKVDVTIGPNLYEREVYVD